MVMCTPEEDVHYVCSSKTINTILSCSLKKIAHILLLQLQHNKASTICLQYYCFQCVGAGGGWLGVRGGVAVGVRVGGGGARELHVCVWCTFVPPRQLHHCFSI